MGFGIDVSHHNGVIDWKKVVADPQKVQFAYLKADEGVNAPDSRFLANVYGCQQAGLKWGAYHFATWNSHNMVADAKSEAAYFIGMIKKAGVPDIPLVLDVESDQPISFTAAEVYLYIKTFISEVKMAGYDMDVLYSFAWFLNTYLPPNHDLGSVKLWLASYTNKPKPVLPRGWKQAWPWQYTNKGKIAGINTDCDLNKAV